MRSPVIRSGNKIYVWIPGGEIQYGKISKGLCVWFRGRKYTIRKGRWPR